MHEEITPPATSPSGFAIACPGRRVSAGVSELRRWHPADQRHCSAGGSSERILVHVGEPLEPPHVSPAQGPPVDWGDLNGCFATRQVFRQAAALPGRLVPGSVRSRSSSDSVPCTAAIHCFFWWMRVFLSLPLAGMCRSDSGALSSGRDGFSPHSFGFLMPTWKLPIPPVGRSKALRLLLTDATFATVSATSLSSSLWEVFPS